MNSFEQCLLRAKEGKHTLSWRKAGGQLMVEVGGAYCMASRDDLERLKEAQLKAKLKNKKLF